MGKLLEGNKILKKYKGIGSSGTDAFLIFEKSYSLNLGGSTFTYKATLKTICSFLNLTYILYAQ